MSKTNYRPDIDGLRAVAVLSVLLFHADPTWLSGGYVGVDVFFVISGFLITGGIVADCARGTFSISSFYERRARRIVPALAAALTASSIAALFLLLPNELIAFGKSMLAAAASAANVYFWTDSGYFAAPAETKPLLHTWSLAVEEQFYLFFPPVFTLLFKRGKRFLSWSCGALMLGSLALSVVTVARAPSAAFYLLPTRAWELLVGSLLALNIVPAPRTRLLRECAAMVGTGLLLSSLVMYSPSTVFPGLSAVLPCFGAAALIYASSSGPTLMGQLLSLRPVVAVGLISYSLYLLHWPVLVFTKMFAIRVLSAPELAAALLGSGVLSALSWKFVEQPFRRKGFLSRRQVFAYAAAAMVAPAALGLTLWLGGGLSSRLPEDVRALLDVEKDKGCDVPSLRELQANGPCVAVEAKDSASTTLLWGDSHARTFLPALRPGARHTETRLLIAWNTGCGPLLGIDVADSPHSQCADRNAAVAKWIAEHPPAHVILAGRWALLAEGHGFGRETGGHARLEDVEQRAGGPASQREIFRRGLLRTANFLRSRGIPFSLVASVPEVGLQVPETLARIHWWTRGFDARPAVADFLERQRFVFQVLGEVQKSFDASLFQPHSALCDQAFCQVEQDGHALYFDDDHLSLAGAELLAPPVMDWFAPTLVAHPEGGVR